MRVIAGRGRQGGAPALRHFELFDRIRHTELIWQRHPWPVGRNFQAPENGVTI